MKHKIVNLAIAAAIGMPLSTSVFAGDLQIGDLVVARGKRRWQASAPSTAFGTPGTTLC